MSVASVIQHAMRMRHIIIRGLSRCTVFFKHYLVNGTNFGKTFVNVKYSFLFSLQILSVTFLTQRRIHRGIIMNVHRSSCKVPAILVRV